MPIVKLAPATTPVALFAANFKRAQIAKFARRAENAEKSSIYTHSTNGFVRRGRMACKK